MVTYKVQILELQSTIYHRRKDSVLNDLYSLFLRAGLFIIILFFPRRAECVPKSHMEVTRSI